MYTEPLFCYTIQPMSNLPQIIVVCGPTATGKSALAVELARLFNGEVISADSRQVYTGLDIGSAKITQDEMKGIPHYLIDVAHPNDYFSVADFQKLAQEKIQDIHSRGKLPIICGGTGMYIDAVIYDMQFPDVSVNLELRTELEQLSAPELFEKLQDLDPGRALEIDEHNPVRLIRAIEIATELGKVPKLAVIPDLIRNPEFKDNILDSGSEAGMTITNKTLWVGLNLPKEELQERIEKRISDRIPALFDEINHLHESGVTFEKLYSFGLEYRFGSDYIQGNITLEEFKELLAIKTWQFAKRQMTWFKRNQNIHWFDLIIDQQKILKLVQDFLS